MRYSIDLLTCRIIRSQTLRARFAALLLFCATLIGACDRSSPEPAPAPGTSSGPAVKASDAACALPLWRFAPSRLPFIGTRLGHPYNRVLIDEAGRVLWNAADVGPRLLGEYMGLAAAAEPPILLVITPARAAPCRAVRETLSLALRSARCSPRTCVFEWPGTDAPPLLPERTALLGNWILVSIDDVPPPRGEYPIELIFTDGAVGARSQCITYNWLIAEEEGRLKLRTPPKPVTMCDRATSPWEDRFGAAMAAAAYIESAGKELIVTGPKGKLRLKRPHR